MSVVFKRGLKRKLSNQPLSDGTIYFTTDERRLYIDTFQSRIPVTGDPHGKLFYIKLIRENWINDGVNISQQVTSYVDDKNNYTEFKNLKKLFPQNEDPIIFVDKIEDLLIFCSDYSDGVLTFQGLSSLVNPSTDIWVALYTPNPRPEAISEINVRPSVQNLDILLEASKWTEITVNGKTIYQYNYTSNEDINFSIQPYLLTPTINFKEFSCIQSVNDNVNTLTFTTEIEPTASIGILATVFLTGEGNTQTTLDPFNGSWIKLIIPHVGFNGIQKDVPIILSYPKEEDQANKTLVPLEVPNQIRELIGFCPNSDNSYKLITGIDYQETEDSISYALTFSRDISSIDSDIIIYVVQTNNISTVYKNQILKSGSANWTILEQEVGKDELGEPIMRTYYTQIWKNDFIPLKGLHSPVIYQEGENSTWFNNMQEIITIDNDLMFIYSPNQNDIKPPSEDIHFTIIDFN